MGEDTIQEILLADEDDDRGLMAILEEIQSRYSYLPEDALRIVAESTGRSLVDIYGVATFYGSFSLKPRGKHLISMCLGTACHVRGAPAVAEAFQRHLGVAQGETTPDNEFTLETVNCLGACALGPVALIDGHYFSKMKPSHVPQILEKARAGVEQIDLVQDERFFPIDVSCPRCNHLLMDPTYTIDGCPSIRMTIAFGSKHGWLRLSSVYGSYNVLSEYDIPHDTIVDFFCPHCHTELIGPWVCSSCKTPMASLIVRGGGMLQICPRRGCTNHLLELT